jgi:stress-induced morphogen
MFRSTLQRLVSTALVKEKLQRSALSPSSVTVEDISGGCGSFFKVTVVSKEFEGKSLLQQHRLVNDILADEIRQLHGVTIVTKSS